MSKPAWALAAAPSADAKKRKVEGEASRGGSGSKKDKDKSKNNDDKTQKQMLKLLLSLSAQVADLKQVMVDIVILPTEDKLVVATKQEYQKYAANCKTAGKGHKLGPPTPYVYMALLNALIEAGPAVGGRNETFLKKYHKSVVKAELHSMLDHIKVCRVSKMFDGTKKRLELAWGPLATSLRMGEDGMEEEVADITEVRAHTLSALEQLGGERKFGRAPKGWLEKELQKIIDDDEL
eukprot:TRINITY_DN46294_c0_g1_i1.p2 TRINITY_DN46294_c0_g1~~TRINITY_DN46294_c0_g1_i1.p2  ORF type:complete len:236 (-),score=88.67 TRINITY_DN46294_c0_g1_i1:104-811(-)